ncbi:hypothetical protein Barb4_05022 [Bacteroidales bacterium Barb4]|nr:hypothetical protein Barb4_05022 [Bacteroidales bacterium Barb4]
MGLRDGSGKRVLKERPNIYCIVNHHLQFISSLQDFLPASVRITPHSAALHVGLKSFAPSGHLRNIPLPLTGFEPLLGVRLIEL